MRQPEPQDSQVANIEAAISSARASAAVSGKDSARIIHALRKLAFILADPRQPLALTLRNELHAETGLSLPMIEWALVTSLTSLRHAPLEDMVSALPAARPDEVIGVVLAGNVFVAALRGLALPLLAGAHVIAKTASNESAFARAFQAALAKADSALAKRLTLVHFTRADRAAAHAFCNGVDALSIYGSDETVEELRSLCSASTQVTGSVYNADRLRASPAAGSGVRQTDAASAPPAIAHGSLGPSPAADSSTRDLDPAHGPCASTPGSATPEAAADSGVIPAESARASRAIAYAPLSLQPAAVSSTGDPGAHGPRAISPSSPAAATAADSGTREAKPAPRTRIIAHGHGISAAYVCRSELQTHDKAARAAERVALDIGAYDQHGCLSPHFVCVETGATIDPQTFAQLLAAEALPSLAQLLPPAATTLHEKAEQLQWQATAAIRGELFTHDTHAVSFENSPARPSPGGRQVSVYACTNHTELRELLSPFAAHLKLVGVAGNKSERAAIHYLLQRFTQASVCRSGEMQTPAFDAWADGAPPFLGLFRTEQ